MDQSTILEKLIPLANAGKSFVVDLPNQKIVDTEGKELVGHFDVESFRKHCLVNGLDDIGLTMQKEEFISKYEAMRREKFLRRWRQANSSSEGH